MLDLSRPTDIPEVTADNDIITSYPAIILLTSNIPQHYLSDQLDSFEDL